MPFFYLTQTAESLGVLFIFNTNSAPHDLDPMPHSGPLQEILCRICKGMGVGEVDCHVKTPTFPSQTCNQHTLFINRNHDLSLTVSMTYMPFTDIVESENLLKFGHWT